MKIKSWQLGYTITSWGTKKPKVEYWTQLVMIPKNNEPAPEKGDHLIIDDLSINGRVIMSLDFREIETPESLRENKVIVNVIREKPMMN